jgi:hypothetical protein
MRIWLNRFDVKSIERGRPEALALLRLGWRSAFSDVEEMSRATLTEALEGRGFDVQQGSAAPIDALLPPQAESEITWLTRRAATDVLHDPGLRFIRHGGLLLPDHGPGEGLPGGLEALSALKGLLGEDQGDPLPPKVREVEATGRVGVLLTRLDLSPDGTSVAVEVGLLVRAEPGRWIPAGSRVARVRAEDVPAQAAEALAQDPRVATSLRLVEALGLGEVALELRGRSLKAGAATQRALATARTAALGDLNHLAFPVLDANPGPDASARPR